MKIIYKMICPAAIIILFTGCLVTKDYSTYPETRHGDYTGEELDYFYETVFGAEFGVSDYTVHKWVDDIRIKVKGSPTAEDIETLDQVIDELNYLIDGITLDRVMWDPDIHIFFASYTSFAALEPNYVPNNMGFFWAWWDAEGALYKARILISTEGITQAQRSHLIREELTQSLGIMNDSYQYKDSIFYQEWTDTGSYAEIDRAVISMLYDPGVEPVMTMEEVEDVLYTNSR